MISTAERLFYFRPLAVRAEKKKHGRAVVRHAEKNERSAQVRVTMMMMKPSAFNYDDRPPIDVVPPSDSTPPEEEELPVELVKPTSEAFTSCVGLASHKPACAVDTVEACPCRKAFAGGELATAKTRREVRRLPPAPLRGPRPLASAASDLALLSLRSVLKSASRRSVA